MVFQGIFRNRAYYNIKSRTKEIEIKFVVYVTRNSLFLAINLIGCFFLKSSGNPPLAGWLHPCSEWLIHRHRTQVLTIFVSTESWQLIVYLLTPNEPIIRGSLTLTPDIVGNLGCSTVICGSSVSFFIRGSNVWGCHSMREGTKIRACKGCSILEMPLKARYFRISF